MGTVCPMGELAGCFRFWWRLAASTTSGFVFDNSDF